MTHDELIERVTKAQGRDRRLDAAIHAVLGLPGFEEGDAEHYAQYPAANRADLRYFNEFIPLYTASIDAALALVERVLPGFGWERLIQPDNTVLVYIWGEDGPGKAFETSAGLPLAIILALLNAKKEITNVL